MYYWRKNLPVSAHDMFQLLMHVRYIKIFQINQKTTWNASKFIYFYVSITKKSHMQYMPIYDLKRNILLLKEFAYDLPVEIRKLKLFQIQYFV